MNDPRSTENSQEQGPHWVHWSSRTLWISSARSSKVQQSKKQTLAPACKKKTAVLLGFAKTTCAVDMVASASNLGLRQLQRNIIHLLFLILGRVVVLQTMSFFWAI